MRVAGGTGGGGDGEQLGVMGKKEGNVMEILLCF